MAQLLGDPPAGQLRSTALTKREAVISVTATAIMYFFCPERLWVCKAVFHVVCLGWLTALAYDAQDALVNAWESIPSWLRNFAAGKAPQRMPANEDVWTFERARHSVHERLGKWNTMVEARVRDFWRMARAALIQGLRLVLNHLEPPPEGIPQPTTAGPQPDRKPVKWCGLLVRTRPVHHYGSVVMEDWNSNQSPQSIPWQSYDTSTIASMSESLVAGTHLSLCLIDEATWESRSVILSRKLASGLYWDIRGQDTWQRGARWTEEQVLAILGIEVLGLVDAGHDPIDTCHKRFDSLRQGWQYMNICWNDLDFAIFLGSLVTGPPAAAKLKRIFQILQHLRWEQMLKRRRWVNIKGVAKFLCAAAGSSIFIVGTGGFATPLAGAMFVGCVADLAISTRDCSKWAQRMAAVETLLIRFPQLRDILDNNEESG